ncbi:MAG: hypothetical protein IGS39_14910 [Calothrix sp. C42_A2020_038]|nr:hypothetical protein [Calothrix sp. C42_A2020_038]
MNRLVIDDLSFLDESTNTDSVIGGNNYTRVGKQKKFTFDDFDREESHKVTEDKPILRKYKETKPEKHKTIIQDEKVYLTGQVAKYDNAYYAKSSAYISN